MTPQVPQPDSRDGSSGQLQKIETDIKPLLTIVTVLAAAGGVASAMKACNDVYDLVFIILFSLFGSFVLTAVVWWPRYVKTPVLGGGDRLVKEFRYGKWTRITSLLIPTAIAIGLGIVVYLYRDDIFDPVQILPHPDIDIDRATSGWEELHKTTRLVRMEDGHRVLRNENDLGLGNLAPVIRFDLVKKDRYAWMRIDKVSVRVDRFRKLPDGYKPVQETATVVYWRRPMIFKTEIKSDDGEFPALLLTDENTTPGGSIVIDDSKPIPFRVEVDIKDPGIYTVTCHVKVHYARSFRSETTLSSNPVTIAKFLDVAPDDLWPKDMPKPPSLDKPGEKPKSAEKPE